MTKKALDNPALWEQCTPFGQRVVARMRERNLSVRGFIQLLNEGRQPGARFWNFQTYYDFIKESRYRRHDLRMIPTSQLWRMAEVLQMQPAEFFILYEQQAGYLSDLAERDQAMFQLYTDFVALWEEARHSTHEERLSMLALMTTLRRTRVWPAPIHMPAFYQEQPQEQSSKARQTRKKGEVPHSSSLLVTQ